MERQPTTDPQLESLFRKFQLLRDDVKSVALGYSGGMVVYGRGGIGKTWVIRDELRRLRVPTRENTARMTARALYEHLRVFPDDLTLIEDNEALLKDQYAVGVLRAAVWAPPAAGREGGGRVPDRPVTWFVSRDRDEFVFSGAVIIVQNSPPPKNPEVEALLTRVLETHFQVSDGELTAYMRHLAATEPPSVMGYAMSVGEAGEVCEFVVRETLSRNRPLDVRLLYKTYSFFAQFQIGESGAHWEDRVLALINRRAPRFAHPVDLSGATRLDRQAQERELVREILAATDVRGEQVKLWTDRTGKCARTFDTRKAEVRAEDGAA